MSAHSILGASSAYRWWNCPGSVKLSAGIPDETSPYAAEGTLAHELGEFCLKNNKNPDEVPYDQPADMNPAVQIYVDTVRFISDGKGKSRYLEKTVSLEKLNPPVDMFGTADCIVYDEDRRRLTVIDYKHGAGVFVTAENNMQLKYYALGALLEFDDKEVDLVEAVIVQPRYHSDDPPVRTVEFEVADLILWGEQLMEHARATQAADPEFNIGSHCKFCKASGLCPKLRDESFALAQVEFSAERTAQPPAPRDLSPDELGRVLVQADVIEHWLKAVRGHVHSMLERGEAVPGVKLVQKRAMRKWINEKNAAEFLGDIMKPSEVFDAKLRSPAQIEKILGKKTADEIGLDLYVEKVSSGTTIALESDTRQAIESAAGVEFLS